MKVALGYSAFGSATDVRQGHDISSNVADVELGKTSGIIPASSTDPVQFIYSRQDMKTFALQAMVGSLHGGAMDVKLYGCLDYVPRQGADQDESQAIRAGHWVMIADGSSNWAPYAAIADNWTGILYFQYASELHLPFFKVVFTPDGNQTAAVDLDLFSFATF